MEVDDKLELAGKAVVGGVQGIINSIPVLMMFAVMFRLLFDIFNAVFTGNVYR
mgnify:CR=1 FL=1|jgi:hypothetical protein|tara:strand:+ start:551 stop:709 length:159 start_codon:yes stop_codon:yes gene_type:complete